MQSEQTSLAAVFNIIGNSEVIQNSTWQQKRANNKNNGQT